MQDKVSEKMFDNLYLVYNILFFLLNETLEDNGLKTLQARLSGIHP